MTSWSGGRREEEDVVSSRLVDASKWKAVPAETLARRRLAEAPGCVTLGILLFLSEPLSLCLK